MIGESVLLSELQGIEDRPGLMGALMRFGYGSPLYRYTLIGRTPVRRRKLF